jgi:hypothetical protein
MKLEDTDASAQQWLIERLSTASQPDASKILVELEINHLRGEPLQRLPSYQQALFQSVLAQRQATYDSTIAADWEQVRSRFNRTGEFYLEMQEYRLYPTVLRPDGKPDTKFATAPTADRGGVRSFDIVEEANAIETQKQLNRDNPFSNFTISHLHSANWNIGCYGKVAEPLYAGFKLLVAQQLEDFKAQHGGSLTQKLILQSPSGILLHLGSEQLLMGYQVVFPPLPEEQKQGVFGKLLKHLPSKS